MHSLPVDGMGLSVSALYQEVLLESCPADCWTHVPGQRQSLGVDPSAWRSVIKRDDKSIISQWEHAEWPYKNIANNAVIAVCLLHIHVATLKRTVATVLADLSMVGTASTHFVNSHWQWRCSGSHHQILETEAQQSRSLFDAMELSQELGATQVSQSSSCDSCAGRHHT